MQAVNYLINKSLPSATFGWVIDPSASPAGGYAVAPPAKGLIHLTDTLGIGTGRLALGVEARDIANFYIAAAVTSYRASFVATTKPGADAGMEDDNADPAASTGFWNEVLWE